MTLPLPETLTPSKISSYQNCPLAFRFDNIDKIRGPETLDQFRGTFVHSVLERLYQLPRYLRTWPAAVAILNVHGTAVIGTEAWWQMEATTEQRDVFMLEVSRLVKRHFDLLDPTTVKPVGIEVMVRSEIDGFTLRGIIDLLVLTPEGELECWDWKTGKPPAPRYQAKRLEGVEVYAHLVEQVIGVRPARVRLLFLGGDAPATVTAEVTDAGIKLTRLKARAIWAAIERACESEDFRPRPSRLCDWCPHQSRCPEFGGTIPAFVPVEIGAKP